MRLRSFTTVIIRIIGMMSIIYGLMTFLFVLITVSMMSGMVASVSSIIGMQLLVPILMSAIGLILIVGSRSLAKALCGGLED